MSRPSALERYESCAHCFACDRMAGMAKLPVWYSSGETRDESVADAYRCDVCCAWEDRDLAAYADSAKDSLGEYITSLLHEEMA